MLIHYKKVLLVLGFFSLMMVVLQPGMIFANEPERVTDQDLVLGGIALSDPIEKVIDKYGKPTNSKDYSFMGQTVTQYTYNGELDFYFLKDSNQIITIQSQSNKIFTNRNLTIGNTDSDIFHSYGNRFSKQTTNQGTEVYLFTPRPMSPQLTFEVNSSTHQIVKIIINKPSFY